MDAHQAAMEAYSIYSRYRRAVDAAACEAGIELIQLLQPIDKQLPLRIAELLDVDEWPAAYAYQLIMQAGEGNKQ